MTRVNRIEIGYRNAEGPGRGQVSRQVPEEALMLTGDENIVDINFTVFWVIKDAQAYLFNIRNPEATVKSAAESAMREVIGETPIAQALSEGRGKIETDTQALLQEILNTYNAGIEITQLQLHKVDPPAPVIDAFRDVQRALADRERLRNEAESYRNDIVPRARGDAVRIEQEAEAYRQQITARSRRRRAFPLGLQRLQGGAGRDAPTPLPRNDGRDPEEQQQGHPRQIGRGRNGVLPYLPLPALGTGRRRPMHRRRERSGTARSGRAILQRNAVPALAVPPLRRQ